MIATAKETAAELPKQKLDKGGAAEATPPCRTLLRD